MANILKKILNKLLIWTLYMTIIPDICQEETESCSCGNSKLNESKPGRGRVYGGEDAEFNDFPWQAALILPTYNNQYIGQGSVITSIHVLTCAHNFYDVDPFNHQVIINYTNTPVSAAIGTRFIIKNETIMTPDEIRAYEIRPFEYVTLHPEYVPLVYAYDIAVIKFVEAIPKWYYGLSPVCLPFENSTTYEGYMADFSGYGATFGSTGISNILQKASFMVQPNFICLRAGPTIFTDVTMMCTYNPNQAPCEGDSGGALVYYEDEKYYQIGVYTKGYNCTPESVEIYVRYFTRVSAFYQWITSVTSDGQYCS